MSKASRILVGLAVVAAAALPPAGIAGELEPGLWEIEFQLDPEQQAQLAEAQKQLESLPPSQRQMMQSMMASRGMDLSRLNAIRACITPEEAEAREVRFQREDDDCEQDVLSQTSEMMKMRFKCPDTEGTATVSFDGKKSYRTEIDGWRKEDGQRKPMHHTMTARWLQADCPQQ